MKKEDWRSKKRSREGSYKYINGNLYARIQFIDDKGKKKEKVKRAENKTHARKLIKQMREELDTKGIKTPWVDSQR